LDYIAVLVRCLFPVPDRGLVDADDFGDFSLEETEVHSSFADVVNYCDGKFGITWKRLIFERNVN